MFSGKRWKGVTSDWAETLQADDTDVYTYCFTQQQSMILKAALLPLYWVTRWTNFTGTADELEEKIAAIDAILDKDDCMACDCQDICDCLNQCDIIVQGSDIDINIQLQFIAIQQNYWTQIFMGSPTDINPDAPTGTWNADAQRDLALCMAAQRYVYSFADAQAKSIRKSQGLIGGLTVLAGFFTGGLLLGVAIVASSAVQVALNTAYNALNDEAALLAVACCMYNGLQGQAVDSVAWEASLDACGFTPGSNEAIVRDLVAATLDEPGNLYAMYEATGTAYAQVLLGTGSCDCDMWTHTITDFSAIPNVVASGILNSRGSIIGGQIVGNDGDPGSSAVRAEFFFEMAQEYTTTLVRVTYTAANLSAVDSVCQDDIENGAQPLQIIDVDLPAEGVDKDITGTGIGVGRDNRIYFDTGASIATGGAVTITELYIEGTGFNPFI